jgi:hypothetical protein
MQVRIAFAAAAALTLAGCSTTAGEPTEAAETVVAEDTARITTDDYVAIQQLYARYAHAIDGLAMVGENPTPDASAEAYADLFTEDGQIYVIGVHEEPIKGRQALTEFAMGHLENGPANNRHIITNPVLTLNADGTITGETQLMLVNMTTNPPTLVSNRATKDTFVKTNDGWRLQWRNNSGISNNTPFSRN